MKNRYEVTLTKGRAIIDADNLADLERILIEQKMEWTSIRLYVSMARAVP